MTVGGGIEQLPQIVVHPPQDDTALLWIAGILVPVCIAIVGWWLKK